MEAVPEPDVRIYLDESYEGSTFVILATIVPRDVEASLRAEWTALQRQVRDELLALGYPLAVAYFGKHPHELAEIHAVDMYQSDGYYRKYRHGVRPPEQYWLRHRAWLDAAANIILRHDLRAVALGRREPYIPEVRMSHVIRHESNVPQLVNPELLERMLAEVDRLETKPYTFGLPLMLGALNRHLVDTGRLGALVCDDDEGDNAGFAALDVYGVVRNSGQLRALSGEPVFRTGLAEPLLQVPDVMAYAIRWDQTATDAERREHAMLAGWARAFGRQLVNMGSPAHELEPWHMGIAGEYVMRTIRKGPSALRAAIGGAIAREFGKFLEAEG